MKATQVLTCNAIQWRKGVQAWEAADPNINPTIHLFQQVYQNLSFPMHEMGKIKPPRIEDRENQTGNTGGRVLEAKGIVTEKAKT